MSWALYVVPLLRVLPTYFDAKDEFFFSFFESSQARGLIPSPTERYFQNWTALFEEALLSLALRSFKNSYLQINKAEACSSQGQFEMRSEQ